jgi:peptidoglycan/LPS O-acetylase OafA/YrhL
VTAGSTNPLYGMPSEWDPAWYEVVMPLIYLQNVEMYFGVERFKYLFIFDHSWSVAVEEQFYLVWPFVLLLLLNRASVVTKLFMMAAGLLLATVLRIKYWDGGAWYFWLLGTRFDGFIFGTALAFLEFAVIRKQPLVLMAVGTFRWLWLLPVLLLAPYLIQGYIPGSFVIPGFLFKTALNPFFGFGLLGFCLVGYCVFYDRARARSINWVGFLNWRAMQHLGTISYSTYLLHVPIVFAVAPYLIMSYDLPPYFKGIIGFGLSIGLAHFTFNFVEAQAMRLKKSFKYAPDKKTEKQLVQQHLPT